MLLTRVAKWSALNAWGVRLAKRSGLKPRLRSLESLPSFCTGCGSTAPNSSGHQRRLPINLHSRTTEFPPISGNQRPCRDAGVGAIVPGFAMLKRAKRASHIDPPASSYAIMRRAGPYRGENPGPGEDVLESLTTGPELENSQGHSLHFGSVSMSGLPPTTTKWQTLENGRNVPKTEVVSRLNPRYSIRPRAGARTAMTSESRLRPWQ